MEIEDKKVQEEIKIEYLPGEKKPTSELDMLKEEKDRISMELTELRKAFEGLQNEYEVHRKKARKLLVKKDKDLDSIRSAKNGMENHLKQNMKFSQDDITRLISEENATQVEHMSTSLEDQIERLDTKDNPMASTPARGEMFFDPNETLNSQTSRTLNNTTMLCEELESGNTSFEYIRNVFVKYL
jgi:predicted  nucleic acid-binding Zn-ribbon protein